MAENPKASSLCPFSYNLTFILFLNLALIWADDSTPGIDSWIYTNLPLSSIFFFKKFELLPVFFLFISQYTSFLHIPSTSAFSYIIPNRDRFRMGDIWAVFVFNLYSVYRLSCKGSSFVLINSVSPEPSTVSSTQ